MKETFFSSEEIKKLDPCEKVGLLATISPEGSPHITLITSIQPLSENKMAFGEFSRGLSKYHVRNNPKTGFLMMTTDRSLWRGTALWTGAKKEGPEYAMFNEKPMFRYNTYFGIDTVHYLDPVHLSPAEKLPLASIALSMLLTRAAVGFKDSTDGETPLNNISLSLFNRLSSLKFIAWIDNEGYPAIVPVLQCRASSPGTLSFSAAAYRDELKKIPAGAECAVLALTMDMESVMVCGKFSGFRKKRMINTGTVTIDRVYNSMPPVHGWVFPEQPLEPVTAF
jgi:hypothetical protein